MKRAIRAFLPSVAMMLILTGCNSSSVNRSGVADSSSASVGAMPSGALAVGDRVGRAAFNPEARSGSEMAGAPILLDLD